MLICFFATRSWFIPVLVGAHIVILLVIARLIEAQIKLGRLMNYQLDELLRRLDRKAKR